MSISNKNDVKPIEISEKMTENLNYDLFGTENDPEIGLLRLVINTTLQVAQIDIYTMTDAKPVDNAFKKMTKDRNLTHVGAQSGPKIRPLRPMLYTSL